jgi:hypothetical protein
MFIAGKLPILQGIVLSAPSAVWPYSHPTYLQEGGYAGSLGQRRCPVHLTPCEQASRHCWLFSLASWMGDVGEAGSEAVSV